MKNYLRMSLYIIRIKPLQESFKFDRLKMKCATKYKIELIKQLHNKPGRTIL